MDIQNNWYVRYGLAVAIVLTSLILRWELIPFIDAGTLYITVYPAIFIISLALGAGPGVFSAVLAIILVEIFLVEPAGQFQFSFSLAIRSLLLLFSSFYVGRFSLKLQETKNWLESRVKERTAELKKHRDHLEDLVGERTKKLHSSEEMLRNIYETAPLAHVVWDAKCLVTDWNKQAEKIFGWKKEEVLGKNFFDFLIPPQDRPQVKTIVDNLLKNTLANKSVNNNLTKDGHVLKCEWHNSILHDAKSGVIGAISIGEDITERKQIEEALKNSADRLNRSQKIAHLGSWELDLVSGELSWSDEVYRIFGLKPQEFEATYEAFLENIHPDDRSVVDAAYSDSIKNAQNAYEIEHRIVRKDNNEIRIVHEKCEHIRDKSNKIIKSVGMVHDITERRQAEEKLAKTQEELRKRIEDQLVESYNHLGVINRKISLLLEMQKHPHSNRKKDLQDISDYILSSAISLSRAQAGFLYRYEKNEFNLVSLKGFEKEKAADLTRISSQKIAFAEKIIKEKVRVNGSCELADPGCFNEANLFSYFIALPLVKENRAGGFIFLGFSGIKSMDPQELEFLDVFAMHAASALSDAGLLK